MAKNAWEFTAEIKSGHRGGALVEFPHDVESVFGTRGRVKVRASFDGHPYRGSLAPMGGKHVLGMLKTIRRALGKDVGDLVHVTIELDSEDRIVDVPRDLKEALRARPQLESRFGALAYTYRKEFARWIDSYSA